MSDFLHGVETFVLTKGPIPIREIKSAVVFLVGTAPVHETVPSGTSDSDWYAETVNNPIIILNSDDAVKYFGDTSIAEGYTIPWALDAIFDHGGTTIVVVNVFDPTKHVDDNNNPDPTKVTDADIIGTYDATTDKRTGFKIAEELYPRFGFTPKILLSPVFCESQAVATEMIAVANKTSVRAIALIDAASGTTFQGVIEARGTGGVLNFSDYRAVICYPHLKVYDPATDGTRLEPFSQRLAGVIAKTDHDHGYWWSPSNQEIMGIIGMETQLTASINDPLCQVNQLNANGIVTVFNSFGTGYRTWGNRSSAFPTNTDPKNFINIQRTADIVAESIEYFSMQYLDKPLTIAIDGVLESVNAFLRTLIGRGALVDGKCYFLPDKNPESELAAGHLTFTYEMMPPPPAERITFEEVININFLKELAGGK